MIRLKSPEEIRKIEYAAKIVAEVLELISENILNGATAYDLERIAEEFILNAGAKPAFKGYNGYPYVLCVSVNEEIVHGFPLKDKIFKKGDLVSVDCGVIKDGYYGDAARTFVVDNFNSERDRKLMEITERALYMAIDVAVPGNRVGDIGYTIQNFVEANGFSVIRDYVGHGVGIALHEDPQIPNYGKKGMGALLRAGMTIAIEPMISSGSYRVEVLNDGWTAVTIDRSRAAHFEHTIVIEKNGSRILSSL
ncbi:type I methionyl aminopeptidase [Kosmotoga sp.]|uniref:type I methionyl aminopeptidase n=1 Tax=Kosmotoga sp. TaxID=1955248 RepID=UPI0024AC178F|nr:type I methionyl aminopeptidase [Kosmotoga sp.]MDI3523308.1 methionyl aminopeptidase [Kosmotoga sp.]MDK2952762.1 methionyl aminopeptidase [Kosmotoga sp.]